MIIEDAKLLDDDDAFLRVTFTQRERVRESV